MIDLKDFNLSRLIKKPVTVSSNTTLVKTREILLENKIKRVVVTDKKNPVGIITEKDIAKKIHDLGSRSINSVTADEFKPRKLFTLTKNNSVRECAKLMKRHRINSVIIIDQGKNLEGIITKTDLVNVFLTRETSSSQPLSSSIKISKVMTKKPIIAASPSDPILYVESLLIKYGISRIIVKREQIPVGIITFRDFVPAKIIPQWIAESADPKEIQKYKSKKGLEESNSNQLNYLFPFHATDIMTPNPVTVNKDKDVRSAVLLMIRHNIGGLPVVTGGSKLVGIITKSDIVSILAE